MRSPQSTGIDDRRMPIDNPISVRMGQRQAAEWVAFLASLRGPSPPLEELGARLEDALRLAVWGRNDVILDLSPDELARMIEALAEAVESLSVSELSPLGALLQKLSTR